jgi:hypothetical protein
VSTFTSVLTWAAFILGGPLAAILLGLTAIVAWFWALDGWKRLQDRLRKQKVPGLPCDGSPLSVPERERLDWIETGYGRTAREPGRRR